MILSTLYSRLINHTPSTKPLITVYISSPAILHNLHTYQNTYPNVLCAPVLKSNAYGHGLVPIAQVLDNERLPFFVVDSLYEARTLRKNGIKTPILIIGFVRPDDILHNQLKNISFTITSLEQLQEVVTHLSHPINVHIKVDTGMHRQGILPEQIPKCIECIQRNKYILLEGICSHFADADNSDASFTELQRDMWSDVIRTFQKTFSRIPFIHISATAGTAHPSTPHENMMRLGIGLYGFNPSPFTELSLTPALEMKTIVSTVRRIKKGERVGYNVTYTADKDMCIATVPVGYFEGVDRRLSNCGSFKIGNVFCPIVGRVSMNITSIDVSLVPNVQMGDEVTIVSNTVGDENSVSNISDKARTIAWEILIHIPQHLKRVVTYNK